MSLNQDGTENSMEEIGHVEGGELDSEEIVGYEIIEVDETEEENRVRN